MELSAPDCKPRRLAPAPPRFRQRRRSKRRTPCPSNWGRGQAIAKASTALHKKNPDSTRKDQRHQFHDPSPPRPRAFAGPFPRPSKLIHVSITKTNAVTKTRPRFESSADTSTPTEAAKRRTTPETLKSPVKKKETPCQKTNERAERCPDIGIRTTGHGYAAAREGKRSHEKGHGERAHQKGQGRSRTEEKQHRMHAGRTKSPLRWWYLRYWR